MKKIYIFDMDGTLTPSRREMTSDFENFFSQWANKHNFFLVSGSDLEKIKEQVPEYILNLSEGVFTCGGNQLWLDGKLSYNHCLLYTSPSPRDLSTSRMPSSA